MKLVQVKDLFNCYNGISLNSVLLYEKKQSQEYIPYLRPSQTQMNSISGYVKKEDIDRKYIFPKNTLYISTNGEGSHTYSYISIEDFIPNSDVACLIPKIEMDSHILLFYSRVITSNRYKFCYGRKPKWNKLKDVLIPSPKELYQFTNISIPQQPTKEPYHHKQVSLRDREWKWFIYKDIFDTKIAKSYDLQHLRDGETRYISRTSFNNGLERFVDSSELETQKANCISIVMVGESGTAFYQSNDFVASQNILTIRSKNLNCINSIFIISLIQLEKYRFSYGRTLSKEYFTNHKIKLPINDEGNPDWDFMEYYIKSLPYSKNLKIKTK